MFETTPNRRTRDAIRAAHEARGAFTADLFRALFRRQRDGA